MTMKGSVGDGDVGGSGIFMPTARAGDSNNNNGDGNGSDAESDVKETEAKIKNNAGEALASLSGKRIEDVYGGEHLLRLFGALSNHISSHSQLFISLPFLPFLPNDRP